MRYDKWYSTGWQVLSQSVTTVLQIAISVITKCGNFRRKRNDCLEQTLKIVYLAIVAEFLENYTGGDRSGDRGSSDGGGRGKGCTTQKRFQFQVDYMTGKDFKCSATERTIPTKTNSKTKTPNSSQLIHEFKPLGKYNAFFSPTLHRKCQTLLKCGFIRCFNHFLHFSVNANIWKKWSFKKKLI